MKVFAGARRYETPSPRIFSPQLLLFSAYIFSAWFFGDSLCERVSLEEEI